MYSESVTLTAKTCLRRYFVLNLGEYSTEYISKNMSAGCIRAPHRMLCCCYSWLQSRVLMKSFSVLSYIAGSTTSRSLNQVPSYKKLSFCMIIPHLYFVVDMKSHCRRGVVLIYAFHPRQRYRQASDNSQTMEVSLVTSKSLPL